MSLDDGLPVSIVEAKTSLYPGTKLWMQWLSPGQEGHQEWFRCSISSKTPGRKLRNPSDWIGWFSLDFEDFQCFDVFDCVRLAREKRLRFATARLAPAEAKAGVAPREKASLAAKDQTDNIKRSAPAARATRSSNPKLQERASKGTANVRLKEQLNLSSRPGKKRVPATKSRPLNRSTAAVEDANTAELEVDHIAAKGLAADGSILYQVRWRGYGEADDTWEPLENLTGATKAIQLFEREAIQQASDSAGEEEGLINPTTTSKTATQRARKNQTSPMSEASAAHVSEAGTVPGNTQAKRRSITFTEKEMIEIQDTEGHWYAGIVRAVDQIKGTRVVHYVGWPRAWDETFTEDDMRRRTRPLRITGVAAPTGPLSRPPKKGNDRAITCKIEDEGTLPTVKGRPAAEALYIFDTSIDWSKRFPKADQDPKPKSLQSAMQTQQQPTTHQQQRQQRRRRVTLSKSPSKSQSEKRRQVQPAARRTQPTRRISSNSVAAGRNGVATAQTEHEKADLSRLVGKWVLVNIGGTSYKGRVEEYYNAHRVHTVQWISGIYENVALVDQEVEVVDAPTLAEMVYMMPAAAPLQTGRKRQRQSSPLQSNQRRKANPSVPPLLFATQGHNRSIISSGSNIVPDAVPESSRGQGSAGYTGSVAPTGMRYDYMPPGVPAVYHQHHQYQHLQNVQHQQHAQHLQAQSFLPRVIEVRFTQKGELGLWFGCPDVNGAKTVTGIKAESQAAVIPQLMPYFTPTGQPKPGVLLELVQVNDIMVRHVPFEDALSTIKAAGRPLRLTLETIQASTQHLPFDMSLPLSRSPSVSVPMGGSMGGSMGSSMVSTLPGTVSHTMPGVTDGFGAPGAGGSVSSGSALVAPGLHTAHFAPGLHTAHFAGTHGSKLMGPRLGHAGVHGHASMGSLSNDTTGLQLMRQMDNRR